jgi:hypothetical protein
MTTRMARQSKIPEPQRNKTVALLVIVVAVVIVVAWIGFETLAKHLLWTAGIIAVILGTYFSYLRNRN